MSNNIAKKEIDLDYIQKLLDGCTNHDNEQEKLKQKRYKSLCDEMKDDKHLRVDCDDLCMMLNEHGRISGYSNYVRMKDLYSDIIANVNLDDLQTSKAIAIMYFINENQHSMFEINDNVEKINDLLPKRISAYFGVYTTNSVKIDHIEYRVILTGSQINDDMSKKFNKFCFDESTFEIIDHSVYLKNTKRAEITQFFEIEKIDGITINKEKLNQNYFTINILMNGNSHEVLIINNKKNIDTFNSMVEYLLKYKRILKKIH